MLRFTARPFYLILLCCASVHGFTTTVDMETTRDCGRGFAVRSYDEYRIVAQPLATPIGGADHCTVKFNSDEKLKIYIQDFHVNDCTVTLWFYDNDPSETKEMFKLGCPPHEPPSDRTLTTETGTLTIRLDKASGTTTSYQFVLLLTTLKEGSNALSATGGGGGISTGAIIGIIGGVVVFLVIIIALVLYFVCKQMREKKEEQMRRIEAPNVFSTVSSQRYDTTDRVDSWSRMERERERDRERERETERRREREQDVPRLPEPKVNGILKNSPGRRRRRRENTGDGGYDNDAYTPSVSSTDDGSDFDYETYRRGIEQGVPPGTAKNFSMLPDPPKERRDRRERRRQNDTREFRSASQTSDSSTDENGYVNPAFTDDRGRQMKSASLGKISGKKYAESESSRRSVDDSVSVSRTGSYRSRTRSFSPSRTDGSRESSDTATSITTGSGSRFQRNPNDASIRRSRSRSQSRSSNRSVPRKQRHQQQVLDPSQGAHQPHHHHQHHHRSRSRDRKKDAYLPVFAEAKKAAKQKK